MYDGYAYRWITRYDGPYVVHRVALFSLTLYVMFFVQLLLRPASTLDWFSRTRLSINGRPKDPFSPRLALGACCFSELSVLCSAGREIRLFASGARSGPGCTCVRSCACRMSNATLMPSPGFCAPDFHDLHLTPC